MLTPRPFRRCVAAIAAASCVGVTLSGFAAAASASAEGQAAASRRTERISTDVWKRPLREFAAELASKSGVDILIPADAADLEVSALLVDVDVRVALQRVLAHQSYMLVEHDKEHSGPHGRTVIEIVLFGPGALRGATASATPIRITAPEDRSVDELVQMALAATSGSERATAVDAIAYRDPLAHSSESRARSVLLNALGDPVEVVRAQAIATLKDTADDIPFDALTQVAREDEHATIRIQALELLVERGEQRALGPLRIALLDTEDAVRTRARELIDEWHLDAGSAGSP